MFPILTEGFKNVRLKTMNKKIIIDKKKCINCGLCTSICEEVFKMGKEGAETVSGYEKIEGVEGKIQEAIDSCPVAAISFEENK